VDIVVDIASEKGIDPIGPQDGQGLRSRGGHKCPPCLEVRGPAWMHLCVLLRSSRSTGLSPHEGVDKGRGGSHSQCNCVTPFVDILREGLRGADILRVGVIGVIAAR